MGTRSLTHVKDEFGKTIVTVYRQFDGYPEGHGLEMAKFLVDIQMVNGLPVMEERSNLANGMGCLAAQLIGKLKEEAGNIYIEVPNAKDCWEEYTYRIKYDKNKGLLMNVNGDKYITPKDFIEKYQ